MNNNGERNYETGPNFLEEQLYSTPYVVMPFFIQTTTHNKNIAGPVLVTSTEANQIKKS